MSGEKPMPCLDAETLAAFAEGRLARSELQPVIAHLRTCRECAADVQAANSVAERRPIRAVPWLAIAAVLAVTLLSATLIVWTRRGADPPHLARLLALAPSAARPAEARIAALSWAPYRGPMRSEGASRDARRLQLAGAAGDAVAHADADGSAEAERTAGVALLLVSDWEGAVHRLRSAAERDPGDAETWSDLAAALDAAAVRLERRALHAEALAAADRALSIDPSHSAALFNRALILEHLGLGGEARKSWTRYLESDASSPWANEARERIRRLPSSTGDARFVIEQKNLARAVELVPAFPQQSRTYAEGIYLADWGERDDDASLHAARAIGEALASASGESLLRDSVRAIDVADGATRAQLAAAHVVYRRGRIALSRREPAAAMRALREAAELFRTAHSPMMLNARYFAACARFEADDVAGARGELEALLAESPSHPRYLALRAQIGWQLATAALADADWAGASEQLAESERLFRHLGERSNLGFVRGMQSTALGCLGRPDDAWAARIEALRALDAEGQGGRLAVALGGAARMELHAGRLETARALLRLEVESVRDDGALLANALVRETLLHLQLGDHAAASRTARGARAAAESLSGAAREVALADASLAQGAASLPADPRAARAAITSAIEVYRASNRAVFLPQAHLLRARAALASGDRDAALRDLDEGLDALERHRIGVAGPLAGADILDAGIALGREAIRVRLETGDVAGAFREAERRNLRAGMSAEPPVPLEVLQSRLAGSASAVLMLTMLEREAVAFAVTETTVAAARAPLDERTIAARIRAAAGGSRDEALALYDALVRPSRDALSGRQRLIVVADPLLREVPFAALYDRTSRRHLIEEVRIAAAENATSLRAETTAAPRVAVAIALPSAGLDTLPDAQRELEDVAALYVEAVAVRPEAATFEAFARAVPRAEVVHVAGHTSRQGGAGEPALHFARRRATWRDLARVPFGRGAVVVLSACETLGRPDARSTRALSLGAGALAAGAGDVIGTLTPIGDRDASALFRNVHRGLSSGMGAADALRAAQLDAIASETATGHRLPWRSVALLTRRIS